MTECDHAYLSQSVSFTGSSEDAVNRAQRSALAEVPSTSEQMTHLGLHTP